ncbi:MAG: S26 family signal peptidase [Planctomycetota bacterium]
MNSECIRTLLRSAGEYRLPVTGASMSPTLRAGDLIECRACAPSELRPGQIIVLGAVHTIVVHRYLGTSTKRLVTRGDNAPSHDPLWQTDYLLGRVLARWRNGTRVALDRGLPRWRGWWIAAFWRARARVGVWQRRGVGARRRVQAASEAGPT